MKKIFALAMLVAALCALAPGRAQAGTCTCKLTTYKIVIYAIGFRAGCGSGSLGGEKEEVRTGITDDLVASQYLNQFEPARSAYTNGQEGYDWLFSGWSCQK